MEELIQRKSIRLKEYDYSRPGYYFVTICAHERQPLFSSWVGAHLCVRPPDNENFLAEWLYKMERKYLTVQIDEWCIMPDHIHLILIIKGELEGAGGHAGPPLHEMIKWYKTQTTNAYIRQVKAHALPPFQKHVWQRGYYEHVIRNDVDLDETRRYIQNNPLKQAGKDSKDKE